MTTVILAASLPILPRFFQLVTGRLRRSKRASYTGPPHYGQNRITNTYNSAKISNPSSSTPWRDPDTAPWQFDDSYLPLKEPAAVHHGATRAEITGGHGQYPMGSRGFSESETDVDSGLEEGIRKTVRIETSEP